MNIDALVKIAKDGNGGNASASGGNEVNLIPLLAGGGSAVLAHLLQAPSKAEEKNQTTWDKIRRWLITLGAGAGGYLIGEGVGGKPMSKDDKKTARIAEREASGARKAAIGNQIARWGSHAVGAGLDYRLARNLNKSVLGLGLDGGWRAAGSSMKGYLNANALTGLAALLSHGAGAAFDGISNHYSELADKNEELLSQLKGE